MPEPVQPAAFDRSALNLDYAQETERIVNWLQERVLRAFRRQGAVVGISGGIDSSVVLALCVRAFGPQRGVGILLPERESSPESADLAHELAQGAAVQLRPRSEKEQSTVVVWHEVSGGGSGGVL